MLAGGRGSRLKQLTQWRAKPAVPFGGKFRIIDFPLSNCVNSGIRKVGILTQYKAHSLIQHIQRGWGFMRGELGEFVELLPAQQRMETSWYEGTADAVYQNIDIIRTHKPEFVLILAGDHVYKMDYGTMLAAHVEAEADITVGCIEVPLAEASAFGVMAVDEDNRILEFAEKPEHPAADARAATTWPWPPWVSTCSAPTYSIEELLRDADDADSKHDFGGDIIPDLINRLRVTAFPFRKTASPEDQAYWRDVGTIDAFWEANMELIGISPELNLYDQEWPIWTYQDQVAAGQVRLRRRGPPRHVRGLHGGRRLHRIGLVRAPLAVVQQCECALLLHHRGLHHLPAGRHRAALHHQEGDRGQGLYDSARHPYRRRSRGGRPQVPRLRRRRGAGDPRNAGPETALCPLTGP